MWRRRSRHSISASSRRSGKARRSRRSRRWPLASRLSRPTPTGCSTSSTRTAPRWIVPKRDAAALAERIVYAIEHPDERAALGARGARRRAAVRHQRVRAENGAALSAAPRVVAPDAAPRHPRAGPLVSRTGRCRRDARRRRPCARPTLAARSTCARARGVAAGALRLRRLRAVGRLSARAFGFQSDEATYYMIGHSLARDPDLEYRRADLVRVWHEFPSGPTGVFLKTGTLGRLPRQRARSRSCTSAYGADPDNARLYLRQVVHLPAGRGAVRLAVGHQRISVPPRAAAGAGDLLPVSVPRSAHAVRSGSACSRPGSSSPRSCPATSSGPRRSCSTSWW